MCHRCAAPLSRGGADGRRCLLPGCRARWHAGDCGGKLAAAGVDARQAASCPLHAAVCACGGGPVACHAERMRAKRRGGGSSGEKRARMASNSTSGGTAGTSVGDDSSTRSDGVLRGRLELAALRAALAEAAACGAVVGQRVREAARAAAVASSANTDGSAQAAFQGEPLPRALGELLKERGDTHAQAASDPSVKSLDDVCMDDEFLTLLASDLREGSADELELMPLATASDEALGGAVCEAVEGGRRAQRPDASRVRQKRPSPRWFAILDLLSLLCLTCVAWWTIKGVLEIECLLEVSMMGETSSSDDTDDDGGVIDQGDGGRARLVECSSPLRTELDSHPGRIVAIGALTLTLLGLAFISLLNAGNAIRRTGRRAEALRTHCCKAARRIHAHLHRRAPEISPLVANDAVVV